MASTIDKDSEPITSINVTPLVDIVLVLLIIFMATAHMIAHRSMKLSLPKVAHADAQEVNAVTVAMALGGRFQLNDTEMSRLDLVHNLKQMVKLDPALRVTLSADEGISWGAVSAILDDLKGLGITRIGADVGLKRAE